MQSISHELLNANIRGINTGFICVVEYQEDSHYPINIYVISKFDEEKNTVEHDFTVLPSLANKTFDGADPYAQFMQVESWIEQLHHENKAKRIEFCGYKISSYLKVMHNTLIDPLEVELNELELYIKEVFHKEYEKESMLMAVIYKTPFAEAMLEELYKKGKVNRPIL